MRSYTHTDTPPSPPPLCVRVRVSCISCEAAAVDLRSAGCLNGDGNGPVSASSSKPLVSLAWIFQVPSPLQHFVFIKSQTPQIKTDKTHSAPAALWSVWIFSWLRGLSFIWRNLCRKNMRLTLMLNLILLFIVFTQVCEGNCCASKASKIP